MDNLDILKSELMNAVNSATDLATLEQTRVTALGKKGKITAMMKGLGGMDPDARRTAGQALNILKDEISTALDARKVSMEDDALNAQLTEQRVDISLPVRPEEEGRIHPISQTIDEMAAILGEMGMTVAEGPNIEDDWHNFTALNLPEHHPARDMQDTFFVQTDPDILLRTHTSSVQVRYMENNKPPIRTISPGRVYRNEAISARSHCFFHQVEGLYIDKNVSFADLKQTLQYFTTEMFGKSKIRLRPSYFPFTEPSAEVDVYWGLETDIDYRITKGTGWLEIMGCGMVDPNVLTNCGIDPKIYSGFAFGMGIDRITMLLHQIGDIRLLSENDIRFLDQFKSVL